MTRRGSGVRIPYGPPPTDQGIRPGRSRKIVTGVGGKQILVDDPAGNPVELFEPIIPEAREAAARDT